MENYDNYEKIMDILQEAKTAIDIAQDEVEDRLIKWKKVEQLFAPLNPTSPASILNSAYGSEEQRGNEALELLRKMWDAIDVQSEEEANELRLL